MNTDLSSAPKTTKSGLTEVTRRHGRSSVERCCEWCRKDFLTPSKGGSTARFCSRRCASMEKGSRPEVKARLSAAAQKHPVLKTCEWCGEPFSLASNGKATQARRFCGTKCAASWRASQPESLKRFRDAVTSVPHPLKGRKNPAASERMRLENPMRNPDVRERARLAKIGRTFLARGGNGKLTKPQMLLAQALGFRFPVEFRIKTATVRHLFTSLPPAYSVDLADPMRKVAIEVDGATHRLKRWKFLDARKTSVLQALGWSVLRFTNEEVMENPEAVATKILSFTA